jgi:hypothetical protein
VLVGASDFIDPVDRSRPARFERFTRRGDRYVVPSEAGPLVQSGKLDLELFNVTGLVRQGYDDARSSILPLLVRSAGSGARWGCRAARAAGRADDGDARRQRDAHRRAGGLGEWADR